MLSFPVAYTKAHDFLVLLYFDSTIKFISCEVESWYIFCLGASVGVM